MNIKSNKFTKKFWQIGSTINRWIERFSGVLHIIIILFIALISSQAISFNIIYLQLLNHQKINMVLFHYINIWDLLTLENITGELIYANLDSVKLKIEFLMNSSVALCGILLSLVTFISYFKKNIDFRRKSCFRKKEIYKTGKEDIEIMYEYFKGANFVAIYSHSFSWIKNELILPVLTELANKNKLKLYTGDKLDDVKQRLTNHCEETLINCLQQSNVNLRFSFVERNNSKYLLYRLEDNPHVYVISVHENQESQYLLQTLSHLVK